MTKFRAKIGDANASSLALFTSLGYRPVGHSDIFQETTMELSRDEDVEVWTALQQQQLVKGVYKEAGL